MNLRKFFPLLVLPLLLTACMDKGATNAMSGEETFASSESNEAFLRDFVEAPEPREGEGTSELDDFLEENTDSFEDADNSSDFSADCQKVSDNLNAMQPEKGDLIAKTDGTLVGTMERQAVNEEHSQLLATAVDGVTNPDIIAYWSDYMDLVNAMFDELNIGKVEAAKAASEKVSVKANEFEDMCGFIPE